MGDRNDPMTHDFEAVGEEETIISKPSFLLPYIGIAQAIILLLVNRSDNNLLFLPVPLFGDVFGLSLLVAAVSIVVIAVSRLSRSPPSIMTFVYEKNGSTNNGALLTYFAPRGKKRDRLAIKKTTPYPNQPLLNVKWKYALPVQGTTSSIVIDFYSTGFSLRLGFTDLEDMKKIHDVLSQ
jgi:hypothetical protein